MKHFEYPRRSVVKTITYRIVIIIATFITVYIMTGDIQKTELVTLITTIINTFLYYVHERIWNRIKWGKKK